MTRWSRRAFCRRGATVTGALGLSGLAGCTGALPFGGVSGRPAYADWVGHVDGEASATSANESATTGTDRRGPGAVAGRTNGFASVSPASVVAHVEHLPRALRDHLLRFAGPLDGFGPDAEHAYADLSRVVQVDREFVARTFRGDFAAGEYAHRYGGALWRAGGDYDGYDLYASRDGKRAVAVGGPWVATTDLRPVLPDDATVDRPYALVKGLVDVRTGTHPRAASEDAAFGALADALGTGAYATGGTYPRRETAAPSRWSFPGQVAGGLALAFGDATYDLRVALVFATADDAASAGVTDAARTADGAFLADSATPAVERDGRVVTVTATDRYAALGSE
jgi:hypothetical protein